jgi:hypothetical protein
MAHHGLDGFHVNAGLDTQGCEGVPKIVKAYA